MMMLKALIVIPTITMLILNLADGAPTTEKGVSTYFEWYEVGCDTWPVDMIDPDDQYLGTRSNANLVASSKDKTGEITQMEFVYELWKCTPGSKATRLYFDRYNETSKTTSVVVSENLQNGLFNSTFRALLSIDEYWFGKGSPCKKTQKQTEVNIQATFVSTGGIFNRSVEGEGPARGATVSFRLTAKDGTRMPVPPASYGCPEDCAQNSAWMFRRDK
jgi:hypothetical protein